VGRNKKSRRGGMLVQLILRQGSGVTPGSVNAVLRSRVVRRTAGTCPVGALREWPAPAEIIYIQDIPIVARFRDRL